MTTKTTFESDIQRQIIDAFNIFEQNENKTVDIREVGSIIRSLGCCPSEAELKDILAEIEEENTPGYVHIDRFLPVMTKIMLEHKFKPASVNTIMEAFRVLDPAKKGFLTETEFSRVMMEEGEPFTKEEIEETFYAASDPDTGRIDYKNLVEMLTFNMD